MPRVGDATKRNASYVVMAFPNLKFENCLSPVLSIEDTYQAFGSVINSDRLVGQSLEGPLLNALLNIPLVTSQVLYHEIKVRDDETTHNQASIQCLDEVLDVVRSGIILYF